MFSVIKNGDNRIDIELSGKLDAQQMKMALDDLTRQSSAIENGRMLYCITNFRWPTLQAVIVELSRIPTLFKLIRKYRRIAVLSDKVWIRRISEFEGLLIPSLSIKSFDMKNKAHAEAWLDE